MTEPTPVHELDPGAASEDPLTALLRDGARKLLAVAFEAEVEEHIARLASVVDENGRRRVVRNGYLPEREIQTGVGPIPIRQPRVRVRGKDDAEQLVFQSKLLPPYLRKTKSIEELVPWLYLRGISTNDLQDSLKGILGIDAPGLSPSTVVRLKKAWEEEFGAWTKRSLKGKRYVYIWADGVYFNVRLTGERTCVLVLIGATEDGRKELLAIEDGMRESEQSWTELLLDLKARGLSEAPRLMIADGAMAFWKAAGKVWPEARQQRCWSHKAANVLNKLPKSAQESAKRKLQNIWMAETRDDAVKAFDLFAETYTAKYPKAAECLSQDRDQMLAFYDFPAEHWRHIRTTNPIESTFGTVRQRTRRTKGSGSRAATLSMVFKLIESAQRRWRRLNGHELIGALIEGINFKDGIKEQRVSA